MIVDGVKCACVFALELALLVGDFVFVVAGRRWHETDAVSGAVGRVAEAIYIPVVASIGRWNDPFKAAPVKGFAASGAVTLTVTSMKS